MWTKLINTLMESTNNYGQFKLFDANREVNERHVKKLMDRIEANNLLHVNPIIVDHDMRVIDGQHRLEASRRLGVPVYYIVGDGITETDISDLNAGRKNWSLLDYVTFWTVKKQPGYDVLSRFINKYPFVPLTSLIMLLSTTGKRDRADIEEGRINVRNQAEAEKVLAYLSAIRNYTDLAYTGSFIIAMIRIYRTGEYDHERMMRKIGMQPRALVKCVNTAQYVAMLEELYNYHERDKVRWR